MNKKKKYRKISEKDIEFNCLNPIFWIIKTKYISHKKKRISLESIYLLTSLSSNPFTSPFYANKRANEWKRQARHRRQTKETNRRNVDNNRIPKAIDPAPTNKTAKRKPYEGGRGEERGGEVRRSFDNGHKSVDRFLFFYFLPTPGQLLAAADNEFHARTQHVSQSGMLLEILPLGGERGED